MQTPARVKRGKQREGERERERERERNVANHINQAR
jgi:hypothetical protein